MWVLKITGTTSATPGTTSTHAHGLKYAPSVNWIIPIPRSADDNANDAGSVAVVTSDTSNITVKGSVASIPFTLLVFPDETEPQQNLADVQ